MTTLSRLAKVIKGYTPPIGWIEKAFASLVSSIKNVLPEYSIADKGKVLGIGQDEGHLVNVSVVDLQTVTTNNQGRGRLAANSWDFSMLVDNDEVTVMVNNSPLECVFMNGGLWDKATQEVVVVSSNGQIKVSLTNQDITISCSVAVTEYEPVLEWGEVESVPTVTADDKDKYLHTNNSTGALEWDSIRQTPLVSTDDKDKYLHTNASTGALEWAEAGYGNKYEVLFYCENMGGVFQTLTCNKTYDEVVTAFNNGKIIDAYLQYGNTDKIPLTFTQLAIEGVAHFFGVFGVSSASFYYISIDHGSRELTGVSKGITIQN